MNPTALIALFLLICFQPVAAITDTDDDDFEHAFELGFDDSPVSREIIHPEWFKHSFLNFREDLDEALESGKKGIAVYFGQAHCAYCKALMDVNLKKPEIVRYLQQHFDVIPVDIWGSRQVTLLDGREMNEREYAIENNTNFTPSLIFYDRHGNKVYTMRGYYKPYRFLAMLKFIVEDFYLAETFRSYMERADPPPKFSDDELNEFAQVYPGPVNLDRRSAVSGKPLAVFFEQTNCHACDQLHSQPLNNEVTQALLKGFEIRRLDAWTDSPVITPDGAHLNANQWAEQLGIHYLPTVVFFDEQGNEIIRIDSVVKLYRLRGIMNYVLDRGYAEYPTFQHWRRYSGVAR